MKRLFIAIDLAIPVVERLIRVQEQLDDIVQEREGELRLVAPSNVHVTLKYLGDTDAAMVPLIQEALRTLTRPLFPFEVGCRGLGAFPALDSAQILWAKLDEKGAEVMGLLHQAIERDLGELGIENEPREFKPHVTLGRIRAEKPMDLSGLKDVIQDLEFGSSFVRDMILFESELSPSGPVYRVIDRFVLGES